MFMLFGVSLAYRDNFKTLFVFLKAAVIVANQALYIHYNSRHGHTNYGQNGKSPTINNIESECQPLLNSKINKYKAHPWM